MSHEIFTTGFIQVALIICAALLPQAVLLKPDRNQQITIGMVCGLASILAVTWGLPSSTGGSVSFVQPTVLVACSYLFGPLAGGVAALMSLGSQWFVPHADWLTGFSLACVTWLAGSAAWLTQRNTRISLWLVLAGLVLMLPFLLLPWAQNLPAPNDPRWSTLSSVPWRYIVGMIVICGGVELLRTRALTLQALRMRENELVQALKVSGGGRWEWSLARQQLGYLGKFFRSFGLPDSPDDGDLNGPRFLQDADEQRALLARVHPRDVKRLQDELRETLLGRIPTFYAEFRMLDVQRRWRWLIARGITVERDKLGRALRISGMVLDITAHHDMADALRASEAKYTTFYETLPDPSGIVRIHDGRYIDVNPAFERLARLPRDQILGKTSEELGFELPSSQRAELMDSMRGDGYVQALTLNVARKDFTMPGVLSARRTQIDGESCMVFVYHDVTEERGMQESLLASNAMLSHASWTARLGTWEGVPGQGITVWSDVCCAIHGQPAGTPPPRNYIDRFVAPEWREMVRNSRNRTRSRVDSQELIWNLEFEIIRTDGRRIWVRVRSEGVEENGKLVRVRGILQDVDDIRRTAERMHASEARFAHIFHALPYPLGFARQSDGRFVAINPAWEQTLGFSRTESIGHTMVELGICSAFAESEANAAARLSGQLVGHESEMRTRRGESRTMLKSMSPIDIAGEPCWLIALHDITERKRQEQQVREREELLSLTISAAALGLWDWDLAGGLLRGDERWNVLQGLPVPADTPNLGRPWETGIHEEHLETIRDSLRVHAQLPGVPFDVTWRISPPHEPSRWLRNVGKVVSWSTDGKPIRMLGVSIDVTMQHEQQEVLHHMAHFDALTSLPNRVLLTQRLREAMQINRQAQQHVGVVYIDLDALKRLNDELGHEAGNRLLVLVADRLQRALRSSETVARLSGDDFAVVLTELTSREHCERRLRALMEAIVLPFQLDESSVNITASIGYTLYPEDDSDVDILLRHANQAMYLSKQAGGNRIRAFDSVKELARQSFVEQRDELVRAMNNGELSLYLQPKVDIWRGVVIGAEALVRWVHPAHGVRLPGSFLHLIEGTELEARFSEWVMNAALTHIAQINQQGLHLQISVNIVAEQLRQPGFADWVITRLTKHADVEPRQLDLEITENAALYDINHVARELSRVRALGVSISLDDFGTGYSSLSYLRRLPVDQLKLDQTYVLGMVKDPADQAIVRGIVGLAHSFGYRIVAEGVESIEQGQMLLRMGCAIAQGHGIAAPMPADQFVEWARSWRAPAEWMELVRNEHLTLPVQNALVLKPVKGELA